jgi:hypothetical protein
MILEESGGAVAGGDVAELNGLAERMRGLENRVLPDSLVLGRELYELEPLVFQCQDALGGGG